MCVLKRNSARSPVPTTASQDTEPQTNGRSGVDPVSAPRTSRVSSHMRVISHRRKAGHPFHTHDASASRDGPQAARPDLPQDTNNMTDTRTSASAMTGVRLERPSSASSRPNHRRISQWKGRRGGRYRPVLSAPHFVYCLLRFGHAYIQRQCAAARAAAASAVDEHLAQHTRTAPHTD